MVEPELRNQLDILRGRIDSLTQSAGGIEDYLSGLQPERAARGAGRHNG